MPRSDHRQYSPVMDAVLRRQPRSVLDIGVGLGTYGHLLRAQLGPDLRLVGYEPWLQYQVDGDWTPYDRVHGIDWPPVEVPTCYDLALLIDVLEHFRGPDKATSAMDAVHAAARCAVITWPKDALGGPHADARYANPREVHRWQPTLQWLVHDLTGWRIVEALTLPDSYLYVLERT